MTEIRQTYSAPARILHWTVAAIALTLIGAGFVMTLDGLGRAQQNMLFILHKNAGILLLLLMIVRLVYRWRTPPPQLPHSVPAWQARLARATHATLYCLLFLMPVAGYIRVKAGGFPVESLDALGVPALVPRSEALAELAKSIHYFGGLTIAALVAFHIAATVYHDVVREDGVLPRMMGAGNHVER